MMQNEESDDLSDKYEGVVNEDEDEDEKAEDDDVYNTKDQGTEGVDISNDASQNEHTDNLSIDNHNNHSKESEHEIITISMESE